MTDTWCIENDFAAQRELAAAEEARSFREIEKLRARLAESEARVKALESENETLREIVSESCAALGATCRCSTRASLDFMAGVPGEIRMTVNALQARVKALEEALRAIADGRGMVRDKSTIYMNGRTPEVPAIFNKYDMQEIAKIVLEATCQNTPRG